MFDSDKVGLHWGVKVPLRDGVQLNATVYMPIGQREPAPSALTITPYIADSVHERGMYFATHGVPFVVVDARGRGNSEGTFRPFVQEAPDGYDVVEWLATQPYCNGKVAMCGGSYNGYNQWATAKERPPHLATIIPAAAPYLGVDCPMRCNIFFPYFTQWLMYVAGKTAQAKLFADRAFWSELYRRWHKSGKSFKDLVRSFGPPAAIMEEWLAHPAPDEYWDARNPTAHDYRGIQIPVLTITGAYDDDQPGALTHYFEHIRNASPVVRERHYLVIGPWDHAGTYIPARNIGGIECGAASLVDLPGLYRQWYEWTLQDGPKPAFLQKRVAYYVMGTEKWRYADRIEEITDRHVPFFLDSTGQASEVFASGSLGPRPGQAPPDRYVYDPREIAGTEIDAEAHTAGGSLVDQSVVLALSGKALAYHSAPLDVDTEVSGFFKLTAWISIDTPDTDFYVSVCEINTQGESIRLSTDGLRARYREGPRTAKLIRTAEPLRYDFERFAFISRVLKRGHRLRLVIAPMGRLLETTFAEKNYNGGGVVAEESACDSRPVTVRLHHDAMHPSALHLPLARPRLPDEPTAPLSSFTSTST